MRPPLRKILLEMLLLGAVVPVACASPPELRSVRPDPPISIDGAYDDWAGRFTRIESDHSVGLSVANDPQNLYLCLVTRDLGVAGLLQRAGFTLWLDPDGGEHRTLGVRVAPVEPELAKASTPSVEIVFAGAEYGYQLAELGSDGPIDVRAAVHEDVVAYEIRLAIGRPLARQDRNPDQVTLRSSPTLGLGFEAEPPRRRHGADEPRAHGPGRYVVEPLRVWVKAILADATP